MLYLHHSIETGITQSAKRKKSVKKRKKEEGVDRDKVIRCITRLLNKATDAELRAICGAVYHITKRNP